MSAGFIQDRNASCLPDQLVQPDGGLPELLFRPKGVCVFLEDHIVIVSVQNVEAHIRLFHMLREEPATMGDHGHPAIIARILGPALYHQRHIVEIGVAVTNEQNGEGLPFACHRNTPVTIYLPHVRGSQPQARDISLPKLYNGRAMV